MKMANKLGIAFLLLGAATHHVTADSNNITKLRSSFLNVFDSEETHENESPITRTLNTYSKLSTLYSLFDKAQQGKERVASALEPQSWYDLQLIRGSHDPSASIFNRINRTHTTGGMIKLQEFLTQPSTDFATIQKRQDAIRELVKDDEKYQQLSKLLQEAKKGENLMLSFWDTDQGTQRFLEKIVNPELSKESQEILKESQDRERQLRGVGAFFMDEVVPYSDETAKTDWRKNRWKAWTSPVKKVMLAATIIWLYAELLYFIKKHERQPGGHTAVGDYNPLMKKFVQSLYENRRGIGRGAKTLAGLPYHAYQWFKNPANKAQVTRAVQQLRGAIATKATNARKDFMNGNVATKAKWIVGALTVTGVLAFLFWMAKAMIKGDVDGRMRMYLLQEKMQAVGRFFAVAKEMEATGKSLTGVTPLGTLLEKNEKAAELDELLKSKGLNSKAWTRFYNPVDAMAPKTTAAYDLTRVLRPQLAPLFDAIGTIDAYVSVATLVREHHDKPNSYCFPTIIDPTTTDHPELNLTGVWHPLLDAKKAVPSNFTMGGDRTERNGILTGPNAGGKTTNLTAITTSLVMAQAFGIAAAQEMAFTPFKVINTYMNITDDMAQGRSLFKMEVHRADQLVKAIQSSKDHEYVFSIMDEVFSGTNPAEGQAAAYSIARYLGTLKNSMMMIATHYPIMTRLESDTAGNFKNFKIKAEVQPISYPFNLHEGASNQHIALEILREEGFDGDDLLKYADDIMANPGNYGLGTDGMTFSPGAAAA